MQTRVSNEFTDIYNWYNWYKKMYWNVQGGAETQCDSDSPSGLLFHSIRAWKTAKYVMFMFFYFNALYQKYSVSYYTIH